MDYKEIFTASIILFAVIDIIGATPIVISLREKVGKITIRKSNACRYGNYDWFSFCRRGNIKI